MFSFSAKLSITSCSTLLISPETLFDSSNTANNSIGAVCWSCHILLIFPFSLASSKNGRIGLERGICSCLDYEMASTTSLVNVLRQKKEIFYSDHAHLPANDIERLWQREWSEITSQIMGSDLPASNNLPQKRPAPAPLATGVQGPPLKRFQPVGGPVLCSWSFGLTGPP